MSLFTSNSVDELILKLTKSNTTQRRHNMSHTLIQPYTIWQRISQSTDLDFTFEYMFDLIKET